MMTTVEKQALIAKVDIALDDVRPHLAVDNGNVEVVGITDDLTVEVKWLGACVGCSMSEMTMKAGLEQAIKSRLPEIKGVVAVN
jgi:Fe-S cluster biogenesis protein NfuA